MTKKKWNKHREIYFDLNTNKMSFGCNTRHYHNEMLELIKIEDYERCIKLRDEAAANGVDVGLPLPG